MAFKDPKSITEAGVEFALGLVLVVIAGAELLTGNMALVPLAAFRAARRSGRWSRTSAGC